MEIKEIWKDIPNYEGYYQVSNLGNVKSIRFNRKKLLKKCVNSFGYCLVVLYKNKKRKIFYVHQLVAIAFLNHKPNRFEKVVNHKNFNKLDNRVENLEIVSNRENCNQKHIKSSSNCTGVSFNNTEKCFFSYIRIKSNLIHLGRYKSEKKASEMYELAVKLVDEYNGSPKDFRELVKKEYEQNINRSNKFYK